MDDTFSATLKSVGAIVLTFALFLGVGYYVYTALFVPPQATQSEEVIAVHSAAPTQSDEKTTTTVENKKPS
jgi:hypothetical protein